MSKKILIVDDQIGIRLLLTDILANEGYEVEEASTGKEAIDKIKRQSFDLVILDYKLPILDGAQVLKQLEEAKIEIKAIIMSGLVENITEEALQYNSVKKVIAKPFNISEVIEEVKRIITSS